MKEQKNIYKVRCYNIDYTPEDDYEGTLEDYGPDEAVVEVEATPIERADVDTFEGMITDALMYETGCWFEYYDYDVLPNDDLLDDLRAEQQEQM